MQPIVTTNFLGNSFQVHGQRILRAWRKSLPDPSKASYALYVQAGIGDLPMLRASLTDKMTIHSTERYIVAAICCASNE